MTTLFGATRSVVKAHYALITPEGHISAPIAGWRAARSVITIAPRLGAQFAQYQLTLDMGGGSEGVSTRELFIYVLNGGLAVQLDARQTTLRSGGYLYLPPAARYALNAQEAGTQLLVIERAYLPQPNLLPPAPLIGKEQDIVGAPFMGDNDAILKLLLPDVLAFDMAVNLFTFQPGATLPMVETHMMEHGLLLLQGQGIYRLGDDWHPVQAGDTIWMAPFCPQWFVATGKLPARYIYYKDANRHPFDG
jgi:(S)-ureidoglycine aminohydrolase